MVALFENHVRKNVGLFVQKCMLFRSPHLGCTMSPRRPTELMGANGGQWGTMGANGCAQEVGGKYQLFLCQDRQDRSSCACLGNKA